MDQEYRDEFVTINDCKLHYQDWGDPAAPAILMVHGLTQHSHSFDAVARQLHGRYRCISLDIRGRGQSGWSGGDTYKHGEYLADITALMASLGIARWHYMGTSMGGQIGMMLAAGSPQPFQSLMLNDIGPEIDPVGATRIGAYVKTVPAAFPDSGACIDWAVQQYPWFQGISREEVWDALQWGVREQDDGQWSFRFDPAIIQAAPTDPALLQKAAGMMWKGLKALDDLACPMLLVRGVDTDILHETVATRMENELAHLLRVDVAGIGHAPTLAEPAVRDAFERFYP